MIVDLITGPARVRAYAIATERDHRRQWFADLRLNMTARCISSREISDAQARTVLAALTKVQESLE